MAKKKPTSDRHKPRRTVSIDPRLYEQVKALARQNDRPVQWEVRRAIQEHLRQHGIEPHQLPGEDDP